MTFTHPIWLLLAIPLGISLIVWRPHNLIIRVALLLAILLALAGLAVQLPSRAGTVVVVADRSLSMPRDADALEREVTKSLRSSQPSGSQLQIVSFGRDAEIETAPFAMAQNQPESNMQRGLETALSLIPPNTPGRIVLLSDGRWSGEDPSAAMLVAADRGVAIDYRMAERPSANDLAIERIDAPATVGPGEAFVIRAAIRAPVAHDADVVLRRGAAVIAHGKQHFDAGANPIAFRDRAANGGLLSYTLDVDGGTADPVPENNHARFLIGVNGPKPVLLVSASPSSQFSQLLTSSGVNVQTDPHPQFSLETLANHSAVILENVPANDIGVTGMKTLASWVTDAGGGLMITGGRSSFAAGGYFKSPLEPVLPVSMELRREHRKLRMSIVVTMDRSGSMAMAAGGGRTKMQLADLSAVQVLDLLSPNDELGVVAVDSSSHIVADLDPIEGRESMLRSKIMSVESEGGGIFIYPALATSANMLLTAGSQTKHILLFADANDSEEPGDYKALLERCRNANITVSVIGMGTPQDQDAELLRDIARRGGGQCWFTDDPDDLPRLFAQDTFIVARSALIDVPTPLQSTAALVSLSGRTFAPPPAGGFNLCYLRDGASPAVLTADEYHAPFVASWQAGLGRALAYTGEVDGALTGAIGTWPDAGSFESSLVRWTAGGASSLPNEMLVTQHVSNGACRISLQLDPERTSSSVVDVPNVTTLSGAPGLPPAVTKAKMRWITPDELSIELPMRGDETYLSSVDVPGAGRVSLPAVRLPYSPEYAPNANDAGRKTLEHIARATGGRERMTASEVWKDLARKRQPVALGGWLIAMAVLLLLAETADRRLLRHPERSRGTRVVGGAIPVPPAPPGPSTTLGMTTTEETDEPDLLAALDRANQRAKRKMGP